MDLFSEIDRTLNLAQILEFLQTDKIPKVLSVVYMVGAKDIHVMHLLPKDKTSSFTIIKCDFRPTNIDFLKQHGFNSKQIIATMRSNKAASRHDFRRHFAEREVAAARMDLKAMLERDLTTEQLGMYSVLGYMQL